MNEEDKKIVADYMGWLTHPTGYWYDTPVYFAPGIVGDVKFDLNDTGLVVQEMQKRGDYFVFEMYAMGLFKSIGYRKVTAKFIPWLFNAENFFGATAAWLKEGI